VVVDCELLWGATVVLVAVSGAGDCPAAKTGTDDRTAIAKNFFMMLSLGL
jgi:hypothetical protein